MTFCAIFAISPCSRYILVSELRCQVCVGVAIVCLPIWHWYMFLGDWLKSGRGIVQARLLRKPDCRISWWVVVEYASCRVMQTSM